MLRAAAARPAHRVLPAHPVPAGGAVPPAARGAGRSSRACSAPTWSASRPRSAARTSSAVTERCLALRPGGDRVEVDDLAGTARCVSTASRSGSTAHDFDADCAASREVRARAAEIRADLGDPSILLLGVDRLDYTKGIDVRMRAFAELLDGRRLAPRRRYVRPGRHAQPRERRGVPAHPRRRSSCWSAGSTATSAGSASPPIHYLHQPWRATSWRDVRRGRRHAGHAPARRHEPGGKEYVACRTDDDGAWCSASSPARPTRSPTPGWSTPTTWRRQAQPHGRRQRRATMSRSGGCRPYATACSSMTSNVGPGLPGPPSREPWGERRGGPRPPARSGGRRAGAHAGPAVSPATTTARLRPS